MAELNNGIKIDNYKNETVISMDGIDPSELGDYYLSKSYFDCREYDRSAYFSQNCNSPVPKFLNLYAMYLSKEKKRIDNSLDHSTLESSNAKNLTDLMLLLNEQYNEKKLDGYSLYLYGVILKKLELNKLAITILQESVNSVPTLWSAWLELATLVKDMDHLRQLNLPSHWVRNFFYGHTMIEVLVNDTGIGIFEDIQQSGFGDCIFTTSQIAIAYHNKRDVDKAIDIFKTIIAKDPYRLEQLDMYSNLLFVREQKTEMANLAHKAVEINKYRPETCCVIGNYYSIRGEHQKAILQFQRALRLNPAYLTAWTLMGHEFMELKNTNAAIHSYRQAVRVNRRDFRAWYGLGQAYEIMKMPFFGLYYYKIATQLRPYDSRMLVALGETYEKLTKNFNALKCYQKACCVGDIEGFGNLKLGNLYEKLKDNDNAVKAYKNYVNDERSLSDKQSLVRAFFFLSSYYFEKKEIDLAFIYAQKVLEIDETKNEAKTILHQIASIRGRQNEINTTDMDLEME